MSKLITKEQIDAIIKALSTSRSCAHEDTELTVNNPHTITYKCKSCNFRAVVSGGKVTAILNEEQSKDEQN